MVTDITAVEVEHEIYKCSHCQGFVLIMQERIYDGNEKLIEEQHWAEHRHTRPGWIDENLDIESMEIVA